jgi:hypothetical protein
MRAHCTRRSCRTLLGALAHLSAAELETLEALLVPLRAHASRAADCSHCWVMSCLCWIAVMSGWGKHQQRERFETPSLFISIGLLGDGGGEDVWFGCRLYVLLPIFSPPSCLLRVPVYAGDGAPLSC